jgi:hypothetical protein
LLIQSVTEKYKFVFVCRYPAGAYSYGSTQPIGPAKVSFLEVDAMIRQTLNG